MGFRIFSLILLTDFHFRRQISKSDLLVYLGLICSKKSIWYQMRYQISYLEFGGNMTGKKWCSRPELNGDKQFRKQFSLLHDGKQKTIANIGHS
jgi:hypothetical protein